jgi:hypothetical protein
LARVAGRHRRSERLSTDRIIVQASAGRRARMTPFELVLNGLFLGSVVTLVETV